MSEHLQIYTDMTKLAEESQKLADSCATKLLPMWKPTTSKLKRAIIRARKRARNESRQVISSSTSSCDSDSNDGAGGVAGGQPTDRAAPSNSTS